MNKEEYLDTLIEECEFDYCFMKNDEVVCTNLDVLAEECRASAQVTIEFRSDTLCGTLIWITSTQ